MSWRDWWTKWRDRTGVFKRSWPKPDGMEVQPGKTLWDWLQLLIVPAILIGITFAWSAAQTSSNNERDDRRSQDATLEAYIDQMGQLMLDRRLKKSKEGSPVRAVARTVTLTALRRLEGERKADVVRFLYEAQLLRIKNPPVHVIGANLEGSSLVRADLGDAVDLGGANLGGANFEAANLKEADLGEVDLGDAILVEADLEGAHLADAHLEGAHLEGAHLEGADLTGAHFEGAHLEGAYLNGAHLRGAILSFAILGGADFRGADLRGANLTSTNFACASTCTSLVGVDLRGATIVGTNFGGAIFDHIDLRGTSLGDANLAGVRNLDLGRFITDLPPEQQKPFLDFQKPFLDSLSNDELEAFNLSPKKLANLRTEAQANLQNEGGAP